MKRLVAVLSMLAGAAFGAEIDFAAVAGPVKPVNGVGQPPMLGMPIKAKMFHFLKEAGIPYSRLHDVGGWQGQHRYVDIPNVFRDFEADENDPKNYDFDCTDILLRNLVENGVEPFYRLGVSIENPWEWGMKIGSNERIVPPKDFAKWARICEHVIRHYTEGWANGFRYKMTYWEIWNEPDNREDPSISPLWQAPFEDYVRFYCVVATHLKAKFPHLKIGGYGCCGFYDAVGASAVGAAHSSPRTRHFIECAHKFLAAARDGKWPLDFFSYHSYSDAEDALKQVYFADKILNDYGFTADRTERIYNEWLPAPEHKALGTAMQAAKIAVELIGLQNGPCDMACIYDGRCGLGDYSPLFNPMTYEPHKAYYVYMAFNELRQLGKAVKPPATPKGVYVAAATDGQGRGTVMIANISGKPWKSDLDLGGWRVLSAKVIDKDRTYAEASAPAEIPADSVWLLTCGGELGGSTQPSFVDLSGDTHHSSVNSQPTTHSSQPSRTAVGGSSYSVSILGDTHFDTSPSSVYHAEFARKYGADKLQQWRPEEFERNARMWEGPSRRILEASGRTATDSTRLVLQLGDLIQGDCADAAVHRRMLADGVAYMKGVYPKGVRFVTVCGNHDVRDGIDPMGDDQSAADAYRAFAGGRTTYGFREGPDLFVVVDFNRGREDVAEVKRILRENEDVRYTFVAVHGGVFPFDVGRRRWFYLGAAEDDALRREMRAQFARRNAIVLCGHTHRLEFKEARFPEGRLVEFTMNSVWGGKDGTAYPAEPKVLREGAASYGDVAWVRSSPQVSALFDEYRPYMKRYLAAKAVGHAVMRVSDAGVAFDYYGRDSTVPTRTWFVARHE